MHGIQAPRYWDTGDDDRNFRYNNYLGRFHWRHVDLMDVLAAYQARAFVPLDQIATLLGFPGKMGMSGARVWDQFQAGAIREIRNYCETDVLNTYLVYLRFQLIRGHLQRAEYDSECERLASMLESAGQQHLSEFLDAWRPTDAQS